MTGHGDNCESRSHGPHSSSRLPAQLATTWPSSPPEPPSHLLTLSQLSYDSSERGKETQYYPQGRGQIRDTLSFSMS